MSIKRIPTAKISDPSSTLPHQLTAILHDYNHYLQSFVASRHCATPTNAPNPYQMIIRSDNRPSREHVRRNNGQQTSEIVAIIPRTENGIIGRQDIVICRLGQRNKSGSERFATTPVTH